MDRRLLAKALQDIGCRHVEIRNDKILSTCPNEAAHSDGKDTSPSYAVIIKDFEHSALGTCLACGFSEPLDHTLIRRWYEGHEDGDDVHLAVFSIVVGEVHDDRISERLEKMAAENFWDVRGGRKERVEWSDLSSLDEIPYEVIEESTYATYSGSVPQYAIDRGLTLATCKEWELGHDSKRQRLMIPTRNVDGQLVGITGRLYVTHDFCPTHFEGMVDKRCPKCEWRAPPKYLHRKGNWRNYVLYGESKLVESRSGLIVEGQFDVLTPWQAGVRNVLATYGTRVGTIQMAKMVEWFDEIWVWADPNKAGEEMESLIRRELDDRLTVRSIVGKPTHGDLGELPASVILETLRRSGYPLDETSG